MGGVRLCPTVHVALVFRQKTAAVLFAVKYYSELKLPKLARKLTIFHHLVGFGKLFCIYFGVDTKPILSPVKCSYVFLNQLITIA